MLNYIIVVEIFKKEKEMENTDCLFDDEYFLSFLFICK